MRVGVRVGVPLLLRVEVEVGVRVRVLALGGAGHAARAKARRAWTAVWPPRSAVLEGGGAAVLAGRPGPRGGGGLAERARRQAGCGGRLQPRDLRGDDTWSQSNHDEDHYRIIMMSSVSASPLTVRPVGSMNRSNGISKVRSPFV